MITRTTSLVILFTLFILTGCSHIFGFAGFVMHDQESKQRGRETSEVVVVKLRNPKSGESIWCQDDWVTRLWWPGNEVEYCKEFYAERGYEPVATFISHVGWVVDVSTANAEDLVRFLHNLDAADAQAIVRGQPYQRKGELLERGILPQLTYERIKRQVIVREMADIPGASPATSIVSGREELEW